MGLFGIKSKPKKVEIDYDKLADALIKAHNRIKEQEQIEQRDEQKQLEARWHAAIHYKDYPKTRNIFLWLIRVIRNIIAALFSVVFFRKKYAKDDMVTFRLMRMALYIILVILQLFFYLLTSYYLYVAFCLFKDGTEVEIIYLINYILTSLLCFLFACLFRVAKFEVDNMDNRERLIGILSALSAFLALIVAIISLVVAVMK